MNAFRVSICRWMLATLVVFGVLRRSESFTLTREPADPTVVVEGVNSTQVELVWNFTATTGFLMSIYRERPDGSQNTQIVSRGDGASVFNIFNADYEAHLPATLVIKNVTRNDEYKYSLSVLSTVTAQRVLFDEVAVDVFYPPEITHISDNQTVDEDDVVILNCTADGEPKLNGTWKKVPDNSPVNFPLTITGKQNEGLYRCTADNGIGNAAISDVSITVQNFHPINVNLATGLSGNSVLVNTTFNITCSAQANPPAKYRFYKDQDNFINDTTGSDVSVITTSVSKRVKKVNYSCTPFNDFGDGQTEMKMLTVLYAPSSTTLTTVPINTTQLRGSNMSLHCNADANPEDVDYRLYFNGNLIGNSSSGVLNVTVKADGVYTCVPVNTVGTGDNATVSITVVDSPTVIIDKVRETAVEGANITLTCNVSGKPYPNITWTEVGNAKVLSNASSLTIVNVSRPGTPDNMIQYQCTASNGVETHATATVNVTVYFSPKINHATPDYEVVEGSGANLFCNATGNPQPNITWTKQGDISVLSTSETLNLTNLMREDDGSVYKCTVTNEVGSAHATTMVTVFFPPKTTIHNCPSQVTEGDNVSLYCNATGNPPPKVAWIRSGEVLVNDSAYVIPAISRGQAGLYECMAWNGIGNNFTDNCTVDVQYPPASTMITTLPSNTTVLRDAAVSLKCTTVANPAAHIYHFYLNDSLIGNSSSGVLNITVKADGVYTCVPINTVGTGGNATVNITAVAAPAAEVTPQSSTVNEGENITLTCNVGGVPSPSRHWTKLGSSVVLSNASSLTIVNVSRPGTPDNMIQYQCTASNGVGTPATATVNVTVHCESVFLSSNIQCTCKNPMPFSVCSVKRNRCIQLCK